MSHHTNGKGLTAGNDQTPKDNTTPSHDSMPELDPLQGWFGLAANVKPSRTERRPKRTWKRGGRQS